MLNIVRSKSKATNDAFIHAPRKGSESNIGWFKRILDALEETASQKKRAYLVLLGGRTGTDFRLRTAQAHARHDLTPSHYSHVALLQKNTIAERTPLWEISLIPDRGFGFPPKDNGIQRGILSIYQERSAFPNLAILKIPVALSDMRAALERVKVQRAELDCIELMIYWLGYVWGAGRAGNPLLDGHGIPSAALIEALAASAGFDLTPGLDSRASCPEAIWQAAKWWHRFYSDTGTSPIEGRWHVEHRLG